MFQYYKPFYSKKQQCFCPGIEAHELTRGEFERLTRSAEVKRLVEAYRSGDTEAKKRLPAVTWAGYSPSGRRSSDGMTPTQLYMVDIDHIARDVREVWEEIRERCLAVDDEHHIMIDHRIMLVHITPSGRGLRIVAEASQPFTTTAEHMEWLRSVLSLDDFGDFDTAVKDLSRLSFLVHEDDILFVSSHLFTEHEGHISASSPSSPSACSAEEESPSRPSESLDAVRAKYAAIEYRGHRVADIVKRYIEVYGTPQEGERHNFYNQCVKYFRHICDNDPQKVFAVVPRFTETDAMCMSQCQSICKANTLSRLPREFYFFLKDNGFYTKAAVSGAEEEEYIMEEEKPVAEEKLPTMPPVFRELLKIAPRDFVFPSLQALLPVMGTLTSHLRTDYWLDLREHSTQFFSVIYAGSGMGKGFVERYVEMLLSDLVMRDMLCSERENIYNRVVARNKKNDKDPDNPRVTLRIIEAKCSEADFLEKQQADKGHHMFTYAAEMDQWRKGVRAAGGNKDDMLRIAWDNGYYGQNFKSVNTFKGRIKLYWNVLITGTQPQLMKYFDNVENGLVGRCGFAEVKNQEFALPAQWKKLGERDMRTVREWLSRMDAANYKEPLDPAYVEMMQTVSDEEFDNEIPWRYEFQPLQHIDMTWLRPTLDAFLAEELERSALDRDYARDSFRRRTAVRGLRLGMICTTCYRQMREKERKTICGFVAWFMRRDLAETMALWGRRYNEVMNSGEVNVRQKGLYEMLDTTFDKSSLYSAVKKLGIKTPLKKIISDWYRMGAIDKDKKNNIYTKTRK